MCVAVIPTPTEIDDADSDSTPLPSPPDPRPSTRSGHALVQNIQRGHSQLGGDVTDANLRLAAAFDELLEILK